MNPQLYTLAKSGKRTQFITLYKSLFGGNDTDAGVGYNAYVSQIKGATMGGGASIGGGGVGATGGGGNFLSDLLNSANDKVKTFGKIGGSLLESQYGKTEEQNSAGMITTAIAEAGMNPLKLFSSLAAQSGEAVIGQLKAESELLSEVNSKVGISGELSDGLRKDMVAASVAASEYGVFLKDIGDLYTGMSEKSGKFAIINRDLIEKSVPVATALSKTMAEYAETINEFEKVGLGMDKTNKLLEQTAVKSNSLGLSAKKIAGEIQTSIGKLNEYGFQNGYKGLEKMAQKAVEFRMEMSSVTAIADKVFSPEGAIDMAANLQVLGGAMGDFNDPIKLMYDATNNVGGLQDALIGAAQGLATYNQEQGRFEITGVNLRKSKEMAAALGISMGELGKTAIAAAERSSAATALMSNAFDIPDDQKEFLTNMSRMQDGEMKIVVPESLMDKFQGKNEIALDSITKEQATALAEYQKNFEKMDAKSIAMSQLTETQELVRGMNVVASYIRVRLTAMGKGAAESLAGEQLKTALENLKGVKGKLDSSKSETDQKNMMERVDGYLKDPMSLLKDGYDYAAGKLKGALGMEEKPNTTTAPQPTTQVIKHEISVSSKDTFSDSFARELNRDSSLVSQWAERAPSDLTTPQSANK
jgi:hypothetical protein